MPTFEMILWLFLIALVTGVVALTFFLLQSNKRPCPESDLLIADADESQYSREARRGR